MTNKQRLEKLRKDMFKSAMKQGEGVYSRIDLDLDDFMFLLREAEKVDGLEFVISNLRCGGCGDELGYDWTENKDGTIVCETCVEEGDE